MDLGLLWPYEGLNLCLNKMTRVGNLSKLSNSGKLEYSTDFFNLPNSGIKGAKSTQPNAGKSSSFGN